MILISIQFVSTTCFSSLFPHWRLKSIRMHDMLSQPLPIVRVTLGDKHVSSQLSQILLMRTFLCICM